MAELTDRLPGEIIFASYANQIRDRAVMRYVDAAARDASEPLPDTGEIAYLTATGEFQIYDGTDWVDYLDTRGGQTINGSLVMAGGNTSRWAVKTASRATAGIWSFSDTGDREILRVGDDTAGVGGYIQFLAGDDLGGGGTFRTQMQFRVEGGTPAFEVSQVDADGRIYARNYGQYFGEGGTSDTTGVVTYAMGAGQNTGMGSPVGAPTEQIDLNVNGTILMSLPRIDRYSNLMDTGIAYLYGRNIGIGTQVPNNSLGKNGDIYIRFL